MEEQLRLKESLAQVGELTAGIAHEFRNGLATIHGYARLIDRNALPQAFRPHLDGIRQETEALGEVVTNFLNFARPAQLTLSPVDLRAVVERAAEEVRGDARAHGGEVTIQRRLPDHRGRRRAAAAGVQQPRQECRRGVCRRQSRTPQILIDGRVEGANVSRVSR